jgi:hypothetical protein
MTPDRCRPLEMPVPAASNVDIHTDTGVKHDTDVNIDVSTIFTIALRTIHHDITKLSNMKLFTTTPCSPQTCSPQNRATSKHAKPPNRPATRRLLSPEIRNAISRSDDARPDFRGQSIGAGPLSRQAITAGL